jgi:hypothetical protein
VAKYYVKSTLIALAGVGVGLGVILALINFVEGSWIESVVNPANGSAVQDWMSQFQELARWSVYAAGGFAALWHIYALIADGRSGDQRLLWIVFGIISILCASGFLWWSLQPAESGLWLAYLLGAVNCALTFWLGTALFTAPTHKYAPWGALLIRHW